MYRSSFGAIRFGALVVICGVALTACSQRRESPRTDTAPSAPSAVPPASGLTASRADFARCLQGDGAAGCFSAAATQSAALTSAPAIAPGSPSGLVATASGGNVSLTWGAPSSGDPATSYNIEAGSAPGLVNLANINTGNSLTTFFASGVGAGTYFVRIRAVNAGGVSQPSNEATLVVGGSGGGGCAGPPTGLVLVSQSSGAVLFAWQPPATGSPSSYTIEAGSAPGRADLANIDTGNAATTFSASGVGAGSYYVRVRSRSSCGVSAPSNEVLAFIVGFTGDVQVSVSWDAPTDVDLHVVDPRGEEIYYGNSVSSSGGQLDVDSNPACSIDGRQIENIRWNGAAPGGTYVVRVDYWDSCGLPATNYTVTVKNGPSTQVFRGGFTGPGDHGGRGAGVLITSFSHAGAILSDALRFRAPALMSPSAEKLRQSQSR
jgi:hypothetical protein